MRFFKKKYKPLKFWNDFEQRALELGSDHSKDTWRNIYYYNSITNTIIKHLERDKKNLRILDVGAGHGYWTFLMRRLYPDSEIVAIDIATNLKRYWLGWIGDFMIADIGDPNLDLGQFDIIIVIGVLHHITDDVHFKQATDNIKNMTKIGGKVFIASEFINRKMATYKIFRSFDQYKFKDATWIKNDSLFQYGVNYLPINHGQNDVLIWQRR